MSSEAQGNIVIGKNGIHYLVDDNAEVEVDPLVVFGRHGVDHLCHKISFLNCLDLFG